MHNRTYRDRHPQSSKGGNWGQTWSGASREAFESSRREVNTTATRSTLLWSQADDQVLMLDIPLVEMARRIGRTYGSVAVRRNKLGLTKKSALPRTR